MDQIQIGPKRNLSEKEKKNVFLAVACGCLNTINKTIPGPLHQKRKRVLTDLSRDILYYTSPRLPKIKAHNMQLFEDTINASGIVLDKLTEETGSNANHIMLNLVGFVWKRSLQKIVIIENIMLYLVYGMLLKNMKTLGPENVSLVELNQSCKF